MTKYEADAILEESINRHRAKSFAGIIFNYDGKRYVADNVTLKTIDGKGVCSFYGFKEMKEDER